MNPTTVYDLAHDRLAELHRQARCDALAHAGRRAGRSGQPAYRASGLRAILARWTQRLARASVT
jgi:hypothetical protein